MEKKAQVSMHDKFSAIAIDKKQSEPVYETIDLLGSDMVTWYGVSGIVLQ